jgi:transposase InsO family protein
LFVPALLHFTAAIDKVATSAERPVVHSDRGGHYRWPGWLSRIAGAKLIRSMSRKGCSPDNAACEGFFGWLKIEMFFVSLGGLSPAAHRRSRGIPV